MSKGQFTRPAIIPVAEMRLSYGFSGDCFPLTFELCEQLKPLIASHLPRRRKWHFNDRVLLWLSPELEPDLIAFYQGGGDIFLMRYDESWAQKLDIELLRELAKRLEVLSPGILTVITEQ
ncbi:hypothetical protein EGI99_05935 [Stutzerimonas stutzeri]|nr:hypothetical protein EGI99_05935 [Stutzerimonas stutzeri]